MGGATRFMILLTTPFTPLRPSLTLLRRRLSTTPLLSKISYPSKTKTITPQLTSSFHSQPINYTSNSSYPIQATSSQKQQPQLLQKHPWPEWNNFLNFLSNSPEVDNVSIPDEDAFVVYEELPDHFLHAASVCLAFARARPDLVGLLSRRDIEAVVSYGTPFLFKSALDTAARMRAFLRTGVSEPVQASTVDLMKYLLSYVSNAERNSLYSNEHVDLSVRNLLHELGITSSGPPASNLPASDNQFPDTQSQTFRPLGQNAEMKRGDWICAKCNFMNFAKNMKCLECEESRPKKQLTGGEWDCPQCNFYNYGRNTVCIRCDCRRPVAPLPQTTNSSSVSGYNRDYTITAEQSATGKKFSPFSQSGSSDSQYPQRNDGNKVLLSDFRNQPIHREPQVNYQVQQNSVNETDQNKEREQAVKSDNWFKKTGELHDVKDLPSAVSDDEFPEIMPMRKGENRFVVSKKKDRSLTSPKFKGQAVIEQPDNSNFVPFIPFPPGYFSKKNTEQPNDTNPPVKPTSDTFSNKSDDSRINNQSLNTESNPRTSGEIVEPSRSSTQMSISSSNISNDTSSVGVPTQNNNVESSWERKSLEGSAVKETEQAMKSDNWFKKIAELHDVKDLPSAVSDDEFPEIMPMRKGENQFVVSKKKDRSLTSPKFKRQAAMEQTDDSNFVPFVPFPPGYFSKKNTEQPNDTNPRVKPSNSDDSRSNNQSLNTENNPRISGENVEPSRSPTRMPIFSPNVNYNTSTGGFPFQNENVGSSWEGKSLEGSAVKETDPLDMSEEAKAERWFKRVAQIKDISELSQIPDEDFPSIMPMRKGVNRFVVSKRKTPLERRLTSQQYRRNLPIVTNDNILKRDTDTS